MSRRERENDDDDEYHMPENTAEMYDEDDENLQGNIVQANNKIPDIANPWKVLLPSAQNKNEVIYEGEDSEKYNLRSSMYVIFTCVFWECMGLIRPSVLHYAQQFYNRIRLPSNARHYNNKRHQLNIITNFLDSASYEAKSNSVPFTYDGLDDDETTNDKEDVESMLKNVDKYAATFQLNILKKYKKVRDFLQAAVQCSNDRKFPLTLPAFTYGDIRKLRYLQNSVFLLQFKHHGRRNFVPIMLGDAPIANLLVDTYSEGIDFIKRVAKYLSSPPQFVKMFFYAHWIDTYYMSDHNEGNLNLYSLCSSYFWNRGFSKTVLMTRGLSGYKLYLMNSSSMEAYVTCLPLHIDLYFIRTETKTKYTCNITTYAMEQNVVKYTGPRLITGSANQIIFHLRRQIVINKFDELWVGTNELSHSFGEYGKEYLKQLRILFAEHNKYFLHHNNSLFLPTGLQADETTHSFFYLFMEHVCIETYNNNSIDFEIDPIDELESVLQKFLPLMLHLFQRLSDEELESCGVDTTDQIKFLHQLVFDKEYIFSRFADLCLIYNNIPNNQYPARHVTFDFWCVSDNFISETMKSREEDNRFHTEGLYYPFLGTPNHSLKYTNSGTLNDFVKLRWYPLKDTSTYRAEIEKSVFHRLDPAVSVGCYVLHLENIYIDLIFNHKERTPPHVIESIQFNVTTPIQLSCLIDSFSYLLQFVLVQFYKNEKQLTQHYHDWCTQEDWKNNKWTTDLQWLEMWKMSDFDFTSSEMRRLLFEELSLCQHLYVLMFPTEQSLMEHFGVDEATYRVRYKWAIMYLSAVFSSDVYNSFRHSYKVKNMSLMQSVDNEFANNKSFLHRNINFALFLSRKDMYPTS